jgi:hypothetical protein
MYKISRQKFIDLIKENEKDFETFHMIKDDILLNNKFKSASLKCSLCK